MDVTLAEIAQACQGALHNANDPSLRVQGFTWDSREVQPGNLYVAFPGERVDGHDFCEAAAQAGAACLLVSRPIETDIPWVLVADTRGALARLADWWRSTLPATVVAITGSTGKTSTKALVRDVLKAAGNVVATEANQNNEIGVPRTLLSATADTDFIVVEMGMRGSGQIHELCEIAHPNWGIITNVGESHMELLGSQEAIARAKAELFCDLQPGGVAFVNGADPWSEQVCIWAELDSRNIQRVYFEGAQRGLPTAARQQGTSSPESSSLAAQAAAPLCSPSASTFVWAEDISLDAMGRPRFALCIGCLTGDGELIKEESVSCELAVRGVHNVSNAASAAAVGLQAGLSLGACARALAASQPEGGRQEFKETKQGVLVINDAYNANPDSMASALASLAALDIAGRRAAVLGDMGELGAIEVEAHKRVGAMAADANLDLLVCVGSLSAHIADEAARTGLSRGNIVEAESNDEALQVVRSWMQPGDAVLVKASHFMGFEDIVEGLGD